MSRKAEVHGTPPLLPPEKAEEIRAQLERVLGSHLFRSSRRCQSLLRSITEQTLAGDVHSLKERTLGVEVFGRPLDYDTGQDPVVRTTAGEVRKRLAQYYQEAGHEVEPRIELPSGSYIAEFHVNGAGGAAVRKRHRRLAVIGGSAVALVVILVSVLMLPRWTASSLDKLWAPVLKAPGSVLISIGQPATYVLRSTEAQDTIQGLGAPPAPGQPPAQDFIPRKDLVILWDRYVVLGDVECLLRLTSLFEKKGKPYHIRGERSTSFADLGEDPAVLIGAFNNQWTLRAAGQLRFTFVKNSARDTDLVRDQQHPDNTAWNLTGHWPYWDVSYDYAIVSRILNTTTLHPLVIAAGITQYGTMAAGEFLCNPDYFADAVPQLPRGWEKKNLQIVLRVPVVNRVSGHPRVLAVHVW